MNLVVVVNAVVNVKFQYITNKQNWTLNMHVIRDFLHFYPSVLSRVKVLVKFFFFFCGCAKEFMNLLLYHIDVSNSFLITNWFPELLYFWSRWCGHLAYKSLLYPFFYRIYSYIANFNFSSVSWKFCFNFSRLIHVTFLAIYTCAQYGVNIFHYYAAYATPSLDIFSYKELVF